MAICLNFQYVQIWLLWSVLDSFMRADNEYRHDLSLFWVWRIDKLKIIQNWLEIEFLKCPYLAFRKCFRFVFACWWRISAWFIVILSMKHKYAENHPKMTRCLNFQYVQIWLLGSVFDSFKRADNEYHYDLSLFWVWSINKLKIIKKWLDVWIFNM